MLLHLTPYIAQTNNSMLSNVFIELVRVEELNELK